MGYDAQLKVILDYVAAMRERDSDGWDSATSPLYTARVFRAAMRLMPDIINAMEKDPGKCTASDFYKYLRKIDLDSLDSDAERSLLLSGSCYARALDGLRESSVYWSVVGLYYAAFFSLKAVLGMHGCWMSRPKRWIEVVDANPGRQKIAYKTAMYPSSGGPTGSHQVTWIAFYEAMNHLAAWLTSAHAVLASNPVNANRTWMIDTRNEVNYDPLVAFQMMTAFQVKSRIISY